MEEGNNNNNNNGNYNYNNNNNNNGDYNPYQTYYMTAYCSEKDGKSIHIGVFSDAGCSTLVSNSKSVYAAKMYGADLPYASTPIVTSECISCVAVDNDNDGNSEYPPNFASLSIVCTDACIISPLFCSHFPSS